MFFLGTRCFFAMIENCVGFVKQNVGKIKNKQIKWEWSNIG